MSLTVAPGGAGEPSAPGISRAAGGARGVVRPGISRAPEPTGVEQDGDPVAVFGIRHHGPGSARSLLAALDRYSPDVVLVEGPADADPLLGWVTAEGMEPPLALLAYAADEPKISAFWPYAEFSPEWQAMLWAARRGIEVAPCDLPAAVTLAPRTPTPFDDRGPPVADDPSRDPLGALAEAAGYDDPERWWEDLVEARLDGSSPFPLLTEAMAELRLVARRPGAYEQRREAFMRQTIRRAVKRGRTRVAVVCGAWHAPVLTWPLPPASHDAAILRGSPKRKVTLTWVPWTHERLANATGYGAGVSSPGWYHHLWTAPEQTVARWLTKVARALRARTCRPPALTSSRLSGWPRRWPACARVRWPG